MKRYIAEQLLEIGAVALRPEDPFTWASGKKSPIYCDNRLTLSYPELRKKIAEGIAAIIKENYSETTLVAGTATAGIPHAAFVSDVLNLPMCYIRSEAKKHGRGNQIEGRIEAGDKVIVIEDLISTGGSVLTAVEAVKATGAEVVGVIAIFTYGLQVGVQAFANAGIKVDTLTDFPTLLDVALEKGIVKEAFSLEEALA